MVLHYLNKKNGIARQPDVFGFLQQPNSEPLDLTRVEWLRLASAGFLLCCDVQGFLLCDVMGSLGSSATRLCNMMEQHGYECGTRAQRIRAT